MEPTVFPVGCFPPPPPPPPMTRTLQDATTSNIHMTQGENSSAIPASHSPKTSIPNPMETSLSAPLRLEPISDTAISTRNAQKTISAFLDEYQMRTNAPSTGGNSAVTHQLRNLRDALAEESRRRKGGS